MLDLTSKKKKKVMISHEDVLALEEIEIKNKIFTKVYASCGTFIVREYIVDISNEIKFKLNDNALAQMGLE